jgi:hypothetical protein
LLRIVKTAQRSSLRCVTCKFNGITPVELSTSSVHRKLHFFWYKRRPVRKTIGIRTAVSVV